MNDELELEEDVEIIRLLNIYTPKIGLIYEECHDFSEIYAFLTIMIEFSFLIGNTLKIPEEELINFIDKYFEEERT
jgi:hypothetical protein